MKYIDKSINEIAGKQVVDTLLNDSWNNSEACYQGADYEGLCKPVYRGPILLLMLKEQSNLCCYCLKEIVAADTTLEHIIPHKIKVGDFAAYLVANELKNNVIHKEDFDRNSKAIPPMKYPHDIAYHNLIASCDSNIHCNNYRGDKKIEPFIFDVNIETLIEYDKAGNVLCDGYEDDFEKLGLSNPNSPLKLIRMIWYKLAEKLAHIEEITSEIIDDIIYEFILLFDGTKVVENFTNEPSYKDDVLKYKWFFQYYQNKVL
jgi:hypothetical protein